MSAAFFLLFLLFMVLGIGLAVYFLKFLPDKKNSSLNTSVTSPPLAELNQSCVYDRDCVTQYRCRFETCQLPFYDTRTIAGWTVHINPLLKSESNFTNVIRSFEQRLHDIASVLPAEASAKLRQIPIYWSPAELYPNNTPGAVWHPNKQWMRENNRDPAIAPGIEMTNMKIWDLEMVRQPWVVLHELAHGYHELVLGGNSNQTINAMFERAKASGVYNNVERRDEYNTKHCCSQHYALTNAFEFFAEMSEAYFGLNDMYPYNRAELYQVDRETHDTIKALWGA